MSQIEVTWVNEHRYLAVDSTNHTVVLSPPNDIGIKPSDGLLIALAACAAHDIVEIIKKQRAHLARLVIAVEGEQAPQPPWAYQRIHLRVQVTAQNLRHEQLERAVDLALNKYCSVRASLSPDIALTFEVNLQGEGA